MKVLSLTEPFASLILSGNKSVETRSWSTNYRGEIYIHASRTAISKDVQNRNELMSLVETISLKYGYIICKCRLVDCIYMTKEYVEDIKKNNYKEYICGEYSEGRYAWILEDVEVLDDPIKANGQLGIWDYYDIEDIKNIMNGISYGSIDRESKLICDNITDNYRLMRPQEVIKYKVGLCFDQVELLRNFFRKLDVDFCTYFIRYYGKDITPSHTFLVFYENDKVYWFENAFLKYKGIHEYNSLESLLKDVVDKFMNSINESNLDNLVIYQYTKPRYGMDVDEFFSHAESGKLIVLD